MPNDLSTNDINKPKKSLLQSLHSLSFSDDAQDEDDDKAVLQNNLGTPTGPSLQAPVPPMPVQNSVPAPANFSAPRPVVNQPMSGGNNSFNNNNSNNTNNAQRPAVRSDADLADPSVTLDTIENSLYAEMRKNMNSVKNSAENIKQKTAFDLITTFGTGSGEVLIFNTFLTKEMPYTSKTGKSGTQRVNFFGVMTESGVYAIRASSAITSKLEDALKHTSHLQDDTVGLLGDGSARRVVLKLPSEAYGSSNVLHIALVGDIAKQNPELFTGLDAVAIDSQFIEDLMTLAVSEVEAMTDYEKRRRANLRDLQNETAAEVRKASAISDKLSSLSI